MTTTITICPTCGGPCPTTGCTSRRTAVRQILIRHLSTPQQLRQDFPNRLRALMDDLDPHIGTPTRHADAPPLRPAELDILARIADGASYVDISTAIDRPVATIKSRLTRLYGRLGANGAPQAIAIALRSGQLT